MRDIILLTQGEIVLKGLNKRYFEQKLLQNVKRRLSPLGEFDVNCLQSTIDVIYDHELVNTAVPSNFALKKNAILKDHAEDASITDYQANGELHISYKYHSTVTTMEEIKRRRNAFEKQYLADTADRLWPHTFTESDFLLLYLSRYGRDYVKNYRLKYKKKLPNQ